MSNKKIVAMLIEHCNDSLITYHKKESGIWMISIVFEFTCEKEWNLLHFQVHWRSSATYLMKFRPSGLSLVLFKQPGHIADYCKNE